MRYHCATQSVRCKVPLYRNEVRTHIAAFSAPTQRFINAMSSIHDGAAIPQGGINTAMAVQTTVRTDRTKKHLVVRVFCFRVGLWVACGG